MSVGATMRPVDREAGVRDACFKLLGTAVHVRTDSLDAVSMLDRVFDDLSTNDAVPDIVYDLVSIGGGSRYELRADGEELVKNVSVQDALAYLSWHVMREVVAGAPGVIVHAGAVAADERAIVMPGQSGAGKSTLVAGLLRAGLSYLSDEMAAFDLSGRVVPVPRALNLKRGTVALFPGIGGPDGARLRHLDGSMAVQPVDVGAAGASGACPVAWIVAPRYVAGAPTELVPVTRARGLSDLATNAFNLDVWATAGFGTLADVAARAKCFRLTFGDLDDAVRSLEALIRR